MNYKELKQKQQNEINLFSKKYMIHAFNKTQFKEALTSKGFKESELIQIMNGSFILKNKLDAFNKMLDDHKSSRKSYTLNNLNEVINYEAANYELEYNLELSYNDLLTDVLNLTPQEIQDNKNIIESAIMQYKKDFYKHN